ncbi:hypothetical protein F480_09985 [Bibersteinia trehalosi Y31]|uniref:Uncharacterized protein n=1 Tax=Bibersteinia trehalosi Y31 TaxID=1261658 RepID=A0A179CYJ7_BIBTR|nr:hypothetical protein F480_09985 [Bibersteinia trehalosi Y31]
MNGRNKKILTDFQFNVWCYKRFFVIFTPIFAPV